MKEIASVAANYYLLPQGENVIGFAEFALALGEARAVAAPGSNNVYDERKIETVYFGGGVEAIDGLIKFLQDARKGISELADGVNG